MKDHFDIDPSVQAVSRAADLDRFDAAVMMFPSLSATDEFSPARTRPIPNSRGSAEARPRGWYRNWGKRALDVTLVIASLPITLPVVLICALVLWIEGGNPFYRQDRIGREGKVFSILKLRSMVRNADAHLERLLENDADLRAEWDTTQKLKKDPRVTRVGSALRATSLDELPQLWNVLTGEMSLVGPRPMMPDQLALYGDPHDYFALTPGLTGVWQVSARNESSFAYRATIDAAYRRSLSAREDISLIVKTIGVVVRGTGY